MKRIMVIAVVGLLVIAVLAVGCGGEEQSTEAKQILEEASQKMSDLTSYKMTATGSYEIEGAGPALEGFEDLNFEMTGSLDLENPNSPRIELIMSSMGEDIDMYVQSDYVYIEIPDMGWIKSPVSDSNMSLQLTPSDIEAFSENAQNLKLNEREDAYELSFAISNEYLKERFEQQGDVKMGNEFGAFIDNMNWSMVYEIDKETKYIEEATLNVAVSEMPLELSLLIDALFFDFDVPVDIELPAEAAAAQDYTGQEIPGIPGIPGFNI